MFKRICCILSFCLFNNLAHAVPTGFYLGFSQKLFPHQMNNYKSNAFLGYQLSKNFALEIRGIDFNFPELLDQNKRDNFFTEHLTNKRVVIKTILPLMKRISLYSKLDFPYLYDFCMRNFSQRENSLFSWSQALMYVGANYELSSNVLIHTTWTYPKNKPSFRGELSFSNLSKYLMDVNSFRIGLTYHFA